MNNYIIWNNLNSQNVSGLIICELPPITKPKMRTKITTIDGRDGDIVEELGYESYEKEIKIGLANNFDINSVIKYFTGSGTLVFSNELDKYYKAQIIRDIDFERLIRYKTATISFYVQPYKYKVNESETELTITNETELTVTNSGLEKSKPIITLYGSGDVTISLNGYDVFTVSIDDGYVTIDSEEQEAYKGNTLKNRNMTGEFPLLNSGENTISWSGTLTKIVVDPRSRWL